MFKTYDMKNNIFYFGVVAIALAFAVWMGSCSPSMIRDYHYDRIDVHEQKLKELQLKYPLLFQVDSISDLDTTISKKVINVLLEISKTVDTNKLDSLDKELGKANNRIEFLKDSLSKLPKNPCDDIIKEFEKKDKIKDKVIDTHKKSKFVVKPMKFDSAGSHYTVWMDSLGKPHVRVQEDSIRIKQDCPPCVYPVHIERKFWQFWEFWICPAFLLFLMIMLVRRKS